MHLVALTRWGAPLDAELGVLAAALGLAPYDAKLKLAGPPPLVLASGLEEMRARSLLGLLRQRGHGAVACANAMLPDPNAALVPRAFELGAEAFVGIDGRGRRHALPCADILAIVRAAWLHEEEQTKTTVTKRLALGRALMTGGLLRSKQIETVEHRTTGAREDVVYLFRNAGPDPMILCAEGLAYEGLGADRRPTVRENFRLVLEWLRTHAARAFFDERLVEQKRWPTLQGIRRASRERIVQSSNADACGLAACLLVHAHLQGQL